MAITLKHQFQSAKGDGVDPTQIQPSHWNDTHELEMSSGKVLGRETIGDGPVEELDAGVIGRAILAAATVDELAAIFGVMTTGDAKLTFKTTADDGWILVDDGTIGKSGSGATTRANDDVQALYVLIWDAVPDTWAAVTTGRGASALLDFNAGKVMAFPKSLGRSIAIAGAGAGLTSRVLGSVIGSEAIARADLPNTNVTVTITDPGHIHSVGGGFLGGTTGAQPSSLSAGGAVYGAAGIIINSNVTGITAAFNLNNNVTQTASSKLPPTSFINIMVKL